MNRKVILITGASSGLGLELAKLLIKEDKYRLVLTARSSSLDRFKEQAIEEGEYIHLYSLDVIDSEQREALIAELNTRFNGVDILINNAGFTFRAVVEHISEDDRLLQMGTNFRGPMDLIRLCLPSMRKKKQGKIINISSVGGQMAMPTMAIYSASKHALEGASESLWYEVRPWNIRVCLIEPGFINSKGFEKVRKTTLGKDKVHESCQAYKHHYENMGNFVSKLMRFTPSTSRSVAKKIIRVIKANNPPLRISATWDAVLFKLMKRLIPHRIYHLILYYSLPKIWKWGKE